MSELILANVQKSYGTVQALKNINFSVKKGEFVALLGPNGAGKTSLINCLSGLTKRDAGDIKVQGIDPAVNPTFTKLKLGIVEQELVFDPFFTAFETIKMRRGLFGLPPNNEYLNWLLEKLQLTEKKDVRARFLSGGMKRRLMIAKALAHEPDILILDEPTAGVDVELRQQLYDFLRELNQQGVTIILTTHYLEEAQLLAERIIIQKSGETILEENKENLLKKQFRTLTVINSKDEEVTYEIKPEENILEKLKNHKAIKDIKIQEPSLEDVFVSLTSEKRQK